MPFHWQLLPFDSLVAFYQSDPQGFERYRDLQLGRAVAVAPIEHRPALAQTLRDIVAARKSARSPLEAATLAQCLMSHSLYRLGRVLHDLHAPVAELQSLQILEEVKRKSSSSPN